MWFNFHIFVNSPNFILLLVSNFIPLWSENTFCMVSVLLNYWSLLYGKVLGRALSWVIFQISPSHIKMGFELGTLPYQEMESTQPVLVLSSCVGISFPVSGSLKLFCPCLEHVNHVALGQPHCYVYPLWRREKVFLFYCGTRGVLIGILPCNSL